MSFTRIQNSVEPADRTEDISALHSILARLADCWNRADGSGYGELFTADADYVAFDGSHLHGRAAIADLHQELFDGILKGSELAGSVTDIRFPSEDVAVLHSVGAVRLRWQKKAPKRRDSIQTLVAVRQDGEWRLTAFQNTPIKPPGRIQKLMVKLMAGSR